MSGSQERGVKGSSIGRTKSEAESEAKGRREVGWGVGGWGRDNGRDCCS